MQTSDILSLLALVISCVSLATSVYFSFRDKATLVAKSVFYDGHLGDVPSVAISVVNAGRRPIILRMWGGTDGAKRWAGTLLKSSEGGQRLAEHERFEFQLLKADLVAFTPEDDFVFKDLWIEDTLGRRYRIKDAKENVGKLWQGVDAT